jgi:segregation and condensation protein A
VDTSTVAEKYMVKAGSFTGPLEVLLGLIEARKLFINEISLASVTNEYLSYVRSLGGKNLPAATDFVVVAATLVLIKSRSLLPNLELTTEEEEKIVDLEARLKMYALIREVGEDIKARFGKTPMFFAPERTDSIVVFSPGVNLTLGNLSLALGDTFNRIPAVSAPLPEITVRTVVSIDEMMDSLTTRIETALSLSFRDIARHPNPADAKDEKVYAIVSFLAMLELVREGIIDVLQADSFGDMTIARQTKNVDSL